MPAFDPVRDAVLNSPITSSLVLPSSVRMHIDSPGPANSKSPLPGSKPPPQSSAPGPGMSIVTSSFPSSANTSPIPGTVVASPITRRATDLSMLLNSDPPMDTPLFTPTTPRAPATLSHLLLPDVDDGSDVEQLSHFTPMRRRSSATVSESSTGVIEPRETSYFSHPGSSNARPSSSSSTQHSGLSDVTDRLIQREPFGLTFPTASTTLAFPSGPASRPSTAAGAGPASRPSTAGQPLSSIASALSAASMPPPIQTPQRSPLVSTSSLPPASMAPPQHTGRPASPHKPVPSNAGVYTVPPPAPIVASASAPAPLLPAPARVAAPEPTSTLVVSTSSAPSAIQRPPPPRPTTNSGNGLQSKPPSSLPPPSSSLPPKPMPPPSPPPFQMKRSAIPYAPRRITPAGSVLVPLSPAEMDRYRNYTGGVGTMILRKQKRVENLLGDGPVKREREGSDSEDNPRKKRRTSDVAVVVEHYNARPDVGVAQRQDSPIIGLKSFNNWVKSVLITRFAHPALSASPGGQRRGTRMRGRVLDMGCGKGGDLTKWAKANVAEYVGLDIAAVSIEQAQARHSTSRGARFTASFFALDCYTHVLSDALPGPLLATPFDVVSMQFCMHYAFESEVKARTMLRNVSEWLRPSGIFIGTIPDAKQLMDQLDALPSNAKELTWGNNVYKIRFEDRDSRPAFGHRYWFYLRDAVDDVPEYVVHWDKFVQLASEYGLCPVYKKEFHQVFEEHHEHEEFAPLLQRMHVVDANGESQMDEDQWDAANIYVGFALEKR